MFATGIGMGPETALRSDLVLLCGGTELERTAALAGHRRLIDSSDPVVVGDLQSLLRCAPYSRAVIVCGQLAGMSSDVVEQLIRERAPQATLVRADRAPGTPGPASWRGRRAVLRRLRRAAAIPH